MIEAVIVDAVRTPIGRAFKGSLRSIRADELAALPLRALIARNPQVDFAQTEDVIMGAASSSGEQSANVARNALLLAGIDDRVPGVTVNRFCASSLHALRMAFHAIRSGEGEQFIAAGVESVSRAGAGAAPTRPRSTRAWMARGGRCATSTSRWASRPRTSPSATTSRASSGPLGRDLTGPRGLGRELRSLRRRDHSRRGARPRRRRRPRRHDRGARGDRARRRRAAPRTTMEVLATLEPAFVPGGSVTAGNSCPLNDGAAAVLVMSAQRAERLAVRPRARILASSVAAVEPEYMGVGPIPAIRQLLNATASRSTTSTSSRSTRPSPPRCCRACAGLASRRSSSTPSVARSRSATPSG